MHILTHLLLKVLQNKSAETILLHNYYQNLIMYFINRENRFRQGIFFRRNVGDNPLRTLCRETPPDLLIFSLLSIQKLP